MSLTFSTKIEDPEWGCDFHEVAHSLPGGNVKMCFVQVDNLASFASQLNDFVISTSWMAELDKGAQLQYRVTAAETAQVLVEIFKASSEAGTIGEEFGELMVSVGSARALEQIFTHVRLPLAELWKPQLKQNEGFDFHTVCTSELINFGEAKYSGSSSPHGLAISQAGDFIKAEKHFRDRAHLHFLAPASSVALLDGEQYGVVAAFSINAQKPLLVFKHAMESAIKILGDGRITNIYLVGVSSNV